MLTKKDLSVINTAYFCSTGARLILPHPSPSDIYQVASRIENASAKSIERAFKGSNVSLMQAIQTIPGLSYAPWFNGNMLNITLHPFIAVFCNLAFQNRLLESNQSSTINQLDVSLMVDHLNYQVQTIEFHRNSVRWDVPFHISQLSIDTIFRDIEKNSSGFELHEFCVNYDATQNESVQFENLMMQIHNDLKLQLNQVEPDKCLAILLKKEPCLNSRMNLRYIVILQKDFIDEPSGFKDFSFFKILKKTVETNSCYTITYDSEYLNGFLASNHFSMKNPNYRERIKCLKNYLLGTDKLYRVDGFDTSFGIVYSKFD